MNNADNLIMISCFLPKKISSWKIYWSSIVQFDVEHFSAKCAFQFLPQKTSIFDLNSHWKQSITLVVTADSSDATGNQRGSLFPWKLMSLLQRNRLFVCTPLCNILTQCWYFDWQFALSKLWAQISTCCLVQLVFRENSVVKAAVSITITSPFAKTGFPTWSTACKLSSKKWIISNQNTNIEWQYCKVARKRTTGFTVISW